ncbi:PIG-L family deacetylase [Sphingobium algorifonticola]|uniref:PIG-L family deacetylase n=2 Tax=Sphingobium algorifonticola TaxID=2008318 RepID=A0A437JAD0_9SPHN|nr:PIG-L family deacetylase [Sphingobium algorifonticola]
MPLSARPWRDLRWLILAPHPDDETLGAGALIAQAARTGHLAGVVYLTDGSGSHLVSDGRSGAIKAVRRREAATAVRRLTGSRQQPPVHLDWKDAAPLNEGEAGFDRACRRLVSLCRQRAVDAVAVTALHEPHCDHVAAARLAYAVQKNVRHRLVVAEYRVWASSVDRATHRALVTAPMPPGKRRHALHAHRSQLTAAYGPGFRLPVERQHMAARDTLHLRRRA